jgi:cell wall-associated NlpC family hydrolase
MIPGGRRRTGDLRVGQDPPRDVAIAMTVAIVLALLAGLVAALTIMHTGQAGESSGQQLLLPAAAPYVAAQNPVPAPQSNVPTSVLPPTSSLAPMGQWTQQRGIAIAERALRWYGWPYSFGAGGPDGPSYGVAVDFDSRNDASIRGFDCSGLVMYALGPWLNLQHDAAKQYNEVGHFHPMLSELEPGDMLFWSQDGMVNGIGHVAIYIGGGRVVQAPHSGAYVDVVPINEVESGRIGVTRPLT